MCACERTCTHVYMFARVCMMGEGLCLQDPVLPGWLHTLALPAFACSFLTQGTPGTWIFAAPLPAPLLETSALSQEDPSSAGIPLLFISQLFLNEKCETFAKVQRRVRFPTVYFPPGFNSCECSAIFVGVSYVERGSCTRPDPSSASTLVGVSWEGEHPPLSPSSHTEINNNSTVTPNFQPVIGCPQLCQEYFSYLTLHPRPIKVYVWD